MQRYLIAAALCLVLLALPGDAMARVIELGSGAEKGAVSCPANCQAVGRVTGYQGRSGDLRNPFVVPRRGKIVAFTVQLGEPDANQVRFFEDLYGGPSRARVAILRRGKKRRSRKNFRLLRQSKAYELQDYFGTSPTFALDEPIPVSKNHVVGITVDTWAPMFSVGLVRSNWWRSSRAKGRCDNVSQRAQHVRRGTVKTYGCDYFTARLLYTATYIPDPRPKRRRTS